MPNEGQSLIRHGKSIGPLRNASAAGLSMFGYWLREPLSM